ncbi:MAG: hypothetical protein IPM98_05975 [Lewinellaceae bacterium]|nr:hypothetical protein [Lewinellaceae bacterium]
MKDTTIFRITALWAFSECALGGIMHALKLPFTGLFVGGFAVLCVGLLAQVSERNAAIVLRSTLLVILVKALVSPHSPPTAYLAVGFQGVTGALLLCYLRPFGAAALLYGFLAITESALQKLLTLFLFFGKPLFEALDLFFVDVLEKFDVQSAVSWASMVVYAYIGFYGLWGLMLGYWIPRLPGQLQRRTAAYADLHLDASLPDATPKRKFRQKGIMLFAVLLFIVCTFLLAGGKASGGQKALYAVLRTTAVLAAWFFLVQPLVTYLFKRWAKRRSEEERGALQQIVEFMPDLRVRALPLYRHVAQQHSGWRRWPEFVLALFAVAMQVKKEETP